MRLPLMMLAILLIAAVTGLGSAYVALHGAPPVGGVQVGPWKSWPSMGSRQSDPYSRAIVTISGALPLGSGEGVIFVADRDDRGEPLEGRCVYRVSGDVPQARAWTLTLTDGRGEAIDSGLGETTAASTSVLRGPDGLPSLTLAHDPMPGNWLQTPAKGRFRLTLRLYDSPVSLSARAPETRTMPTIARLSCGSASKPATVVPAAVKPAPPEAPAPTPPAKALDAPPDITPPAPTPAASPDSTSSIAPAGDGTTLPREGAAE